jgi:hypothetical protein
METIVKEQLRTEVGDTFQDLINTISAFKDEQFNLVPFEGSWTPAQVAEHLVKCTSAVPDEHTQSTSRPYDEMVKPIGDIFLNFTIKLQSPDFGLPGNSPQEKTAMLETFRGIKAHLEDTARTTDLEATCVDFELPTMGTLTRYEWLKFFIFHTRRHTRQLKNILISVNSQ